MPTRWQRRTTAAHVRSASSAHGLAVAEVASTIGPAGTFYCHRVDQLSSQSSRKVRFEPAGGQSVECRRGPVLGQFHVTVCVTNQRFIHLATEAMLDRTPIAMSSDIDGDVKTVTGFVQSIEEDADAVPRRWRKRRTLRVRQSGADLGVRLCSPFR